MRVTDSALRQRPRTEKGPITYSLLSPQPSRLVVVRALEPPHDRAHHALVPRLHAAAGHDRVRRAVRADEADRARLDRGVDDERVPPPEHLRGARGGVVDRAPAEAVDLVPPRWVLLVAREDDVRGGDVDALKFAELGLYLAVASQCQYVRSGDADGEHHEPHAPCDDGDGREAVGGVFRGPTPGGEVSMADVDGDVLRSRQFIDSSEMAAGELTGGISPSDGSSRISLR